MYVQYYPTFTNTRTSLVLRTTTTFTNSATSAASITTDTRPSTVSDYMNFTGTQVVRFNDSADWHVTAPYSIEMDVYLEDGEGKWIATCGEGTGVYPEWAITQTGGNIVFNTSATNAGYSLTQNIVTGAMSKRWYRLGIMFYNSRVRLYCNDINYFDGDCPAPYDSANGLAFGSDFSNTATRRFTGRIRNITLGKSLFWTV